MVDREDRFLKVDFADYLMTGEHSALAHFSSLVAPTEYRDTFKYLVQHILSSQSVSPDRGDIVCQVDISSGMGFCFSGEIADITMCFLLEKWLLRHGVRRKYLIRHYSRFRDDALCITSAGDALLHELREQIRVRLKLFRVTFEQSQFNTIKLDMCIFKAWDWLRTNRLDI